MREGTKVATGWRWVKRELNGDEVLTKPRRPFLEFEIPFVGVLCSATFARTWEWARDGDVLWAAWLPMRKPDIGGGCLILGPLSMFVGWSRNAQA